MSTRIVSILLVTVQVSLSAATVAQSYSPLIWAKGFGSEYIGGGAITSRSIIIDDNGNRYVTGEFSYNADFDPGPGTAILTSAGLSDVFLAKYDASGGLVWAKAMGGTGYDYGRSVAVDGSGNTLITGNFSGLVDFDPGSGTANLTSGGIFLAKYDAMGGLVWAKSMGEGAVDIESTSLADDGSGNAVVTGYFYGTADFDPGPGTANLTSAGDYNVFLAKYDASGSLVWAKAMGGGVYIEGTSLAVDGSGNMVVTGFFQGTADFDPSSGTANLTAVGGFDVFLAKYDASGGLVWAKAMGETLSSNGPSLALDGSGNAVVTGIFIGTADFDPGPGTVNLTSAGSTDVFLAKYDALGGLVWAKAMGGTGDEYSRSVAVDGSGNAMVTGSFLVTADFDPGPGTLNLTSAGNDDVFLAKYDASGGLVWVKAMGGALSDQGSSVKVNGSGNVVVTGTFIGTADFDSGSGTANLTSEVQNVFVGSYASSTGDLVALAQLGGVKEAANVTPKSVVHDGSGNQYVTGDFTGTADFDPGSGITNLTSAGVKDIFLAKYDATGGLVWAKAIGGTNNEESTSLAVDGSGNAVVMGIFRGTADFDPGPGTVNLTSAGNTDVYLAKYNSSGVLVWAKAMGGASGDKGTSVALDKSGNAVMTGLFFGTVDFDPGPGTVNLTSVGSSDLFLVKYDASGGLVWAKAMGGGNLKVSTSLALDGSGNALVTGYFQGTADFDPGPGTTNLTSTGSTDIFLAKYDATGSLVWVKAMGGASAEHGEFVALDGSGNAVVTGYFSGTADFDPGSGTANLISAGKTDVFLAQYDGFGSLVWARAMGGTGTEIGRSVAVEKGSNIMVAGSFQGTVDFDPGSGTANLISAGQNDIFLAKYDASGGLVWANAMGGTNFDNGNSVSVDGSGNTVLTGTFIGTVDFDPSASVTELTALAGVSNGFLAVYGNAAACTNPTSGGTIAAAQSGTSPFDPAAFTSPVAPGGHSGTLEYKWQSSTTSSSAGFSDIASSNSDVYDPGPLTQTTWYRRLARVSCQSDWTGAAESNVVAITMLPPVITSFSPASAKPGDAVTLTGTGFNATAANNIVYFGATRATVTAAAVNSVTVTVPTGATYAPITLLNTGTVLACTSLSNFNPTYTPSKASLTSADISDKVDFATGTNPTSVAIGDLDGDGKPDLAVANYFVNTVSVFRNTSVSGSIAAGSFAAKVDFTTGTYPYSVAIGDLDGDGKPDLAVANYYSSTVSVFRNTSTSGSLTTGSFAAKVDFTTGTNPISVAISDLDGDGKADLGVANSGSNTVSVFRNTSTSGSLTTGSFAAKVDFTTGSFSRSVAIGDLDGDGKPDLAVANYASTSVSVFRNTSSSGSLTTGSFAAKVDFTTGPGTYPISVAIGDLDGDGKADLAVANNVSNSVSVFRNTSTSGSIAAGSFAAKVDLTTDREPISVAIGDLDGDGKADLAVANYISSTVSVFRNTSSSGSLTTGSFAAKVDFTTESNPFSVATGDLDGDGKPDLAVANLNSNSVSVLRNADCTNPTSGGTIAAAQSGTSPFDPAAFTSPVAPGGHSGTLEYKWQSSTTSSSAGFSDIASSNSDVYDPGPLTQTTWYRRLARVSCQSDWTGAAESNVVAITMLPPVITSFSPASAKPGDAVTLTGTGFNATAANNIVYFGATRATVTAATATSVTVTVPVGATYAPITLLNTVTVMACASLRFFHPLYSPAEGYLTSADISPKVDFTTGPAPFSVAIGDLDGDGKSDLVVANGSSSTVSVLRNISASGSIESSSFAPKVDFATGVGSIFVAIGDLDGDGKPDLVVVNQSIDNVSILRNTSTSGSITSGGFAAKVDFTTGDGPFSVAIGDLDGDGKPDLAVTNSNSNNISVLRNTSTSGSITSSSFAERVDYPTGNFSGPISIVIGDLDRDGKPDLAVANGGGPNTVSVFRNTSIKGSISSSSFASKVDFKTAHYPYTIAIGDLDDDDKPDLAVANYGANSVSVFRNTSSIASITSSSFAARVDFSTGSFSNPYYVSIGDLDADGKLDMAVVNSSSNTFSVFRNTSSSGSIEAVSFAEIAVSTTGSIPRSIAIGDLDGDGRPDLAVANLYSENVSVFRNAGDVCTNPTSGGTIAAAQSGNSPFDPVAFTSSVAASGHTGTLEYKWQSSTTSNSAGFSDITGAASATYDPGALTQTTWFKRVARVSCQSNWTGAAESNVIQVTVTTPKNWVGGDGNWNVGANWSGGTVPVSSDVITVTSGNPKLNVDFTVAGSLTLSGTGSLTVEPGRTLTVSGTADFGGKSVTFKSDATGTAQLGNLTGTLTGATNVTVERFIPATGRRWRLLTAPLTGITINAAWQKGQTWNGTAALTSDGTGTVITGQQQGNASNANAKGFDFWSAVANSSASIMTYVPGTTSGGWAALANTTTANSFNNGQAYLLFVRGPRGSGFTTGTSNAATTLRPTGTLRQGEINVTVDGTKGHTMVGNPYASQIDFNAMYLNSGNSSVIKRQFWMWDATAGTSGNWTAVVYSVDKYVEVPRKFHTAGNASPLTAIQSGHGFTVQPVGASGGTMKIRESNKIATAASSPNILLGGERTARLFVNLTRPEASGVSTLLDGAMVSYRNGYRAEVSDADDAVKMENMEENLGVTAAGATMTADARPVSDMARPVALRLWNLMEGVYRFEVKAEEMASGGLKAWLEDRVRGTRTPLPVNGEVGTVEFTVGADAASRAEDRFRIVFEQAAVNASIVQEPGGASGKALSVFPNPVTGRTLTVRLQQVPKGTYSLQLLGGDGRLVTDRRIEHDGGSGTYRMELNGALPKGSYQLRCVSGERSIGSEKLVFQ